VDLHAESLGQQILPHEVDLLLGGASRNLDDDILAFRVHPGRSNDLVGLRSSDLRRS